MAEPFLAGVRTRVGSFFKSPLKTAQPQIQEQRQISQEEYEEQYKQEQKGILLGEVRKLESVSKRLESEINILKKRGRVQDYGELNFKQEQLDSLYRQITTLGMGIQRIETGKGYSASDIITYSIQKEDETQRRREEKKKQKAIEEKAQVSEKKDVESNLAQQGGYSRRNPITKNPEYVLPDGKIVPITPTTTKLVSQGKSSGEIVLASSQEQAFKQYQEQKKINEQLENVAKVKVLTKYEKPTLKENIKYYGGKVKEFFNDYTSSLPGFDINDVVSTKLKVTDIAKPTLPYEARGTAIQGLEFESPIYGEKVKAQSNLLLREKVKLEAKARETVENVISKYQNKVNLRELTPEQATEQAQAEYKKILEGEYNKTEYITESGFKRIQKQFVKSIDKATIVGAFLSTGGTGLLYSGLTILAPPVGLTFAGLATTRSILNIPEIVEYAKERPFTFGASVAGGIAGTIVGLKIGNGIKAKFIEQPRITEAIKNSTVKTTYKDLTMSRQLKNLKLTAEGERILNEYLDKGSTLRVYKSTLKSTSTKYLDYLPKVTAQYIEVLSREGVILERINLGTLVVKYKGRIFSSQSISEAVGKVEGQSAKYYTRTLITKGNSNLKPLQYIETLEKVKLTAQEKKGFNIKLKGEAEVELLKSVDKPQVGDITQVVKFGKTNVQQLDRLFKSLPKGKDYGIADITYGGKIKQLKLGILKENLPESTPYTSKYFFQQTIETGVGSSLFNPLKEYVPSTRIYKDLGGDIGSFVSPTKYKTPSTPKLSNSYSSQDTFKVYSKILQEQKLASTVPNIITYESTYATIPQLSKQQLNFGNTLLVGGSTSIKQFSQRDIELNKLSQDVRLINLNKLSSQLQLQPPKLNELQLQPPKLNELQLQPPKLNQKISPLQLNKLIQLPVSRVSTLSMTPSIPKIPKLKLGIFPPLSYNPLRKIDYKLKPVKIQKKKSKKQKAYQASVGAVILGIKTSKEQLKRLSKLKFTGGELRPVISNGYKGNKYKTNLDNIFGVKTNKKKRKSKAKNKNQLIKNLNKILK